MKLFILFAMIFAHIVDDYYLQGILAKMKQKKWWQENAPSELYRNDYIVALIIHSFSWSFMITLPTLFVSTNYIIIVFFITLNTILHAYVDNAKANEYSINLIVDQICHLIQIIGTWIAIIII